VIPLLHVCADPDTGEWLHDPEQVGEVDEGEFLARIDTDKHHYDSFEHEGIAYAIIIEWWKDK
jgi:hypothetical protein